MAVDQAWGNTGLLHIDGGFGAFGVEVFVASNSGDETVIHHDGVGLQHRLVNIARQQQTDIFDNDFARGFFEGGGGHATSPECFLLNFEPAEPTA
jgi:hypothetical protein